MCRKIWQYGYTCGCMWTCLCIECVGNWLRPCMSMWRCVCLHVCLGTCICLSRGCARYLCETDAPIPKSNCQNYTRNNEFRAQSLRNITSKRKVHAKKCNIPSSSWCQPQSGDSDNCDSCSDHDVCLNVDEKSGPPTQGHGTMVHSELRQGTECQDE